MKTPTNPTQGQPILPWAADITAAVRAGVVTGGKGIRVAQNGTGISISQIKQPREKRERWPFEVYRVGGTANSSESGGLSMLKVRVAFGTVAANEGWESGVNIAGLDETEFELEEIGQGVWLKLIASEGSAAVTLEGPDYWPDWPDAYVNTGDVDAQTTEWRHPLARLRAPRAGEPSILLGGAAVFLEHFTKTDLAVREDCALMVDKETIFYLAPWSRVGRPA